MPPTSTHSVTANGASGNTPHPWIIITLAATAHSHREREELQRFREREAWERKVRAIPNSVMSPAGKLVMLDSWAEAQYRRERGIEGLHPIWIEGRKDRVGMSRDSYGDAMSKQLAEAGAVIRAEKPDPRSGNKRVHIQFTEAFWNPELLHRETPRNQGGARKPKCPECGGEQFKPVRWACQGCGTLYDQLPPPGPEEDPEPTPPSGKLPHKVVPQWGGVLRGKLPLGPRRSVAWPTRWGLGSWWRPRRRRDVRVRKPLQIPQQAS
ncbi:MAG: hypothetical protein M3P51_01950 [Chloroflexota bacterium]|nr:hypothetical protein [Chloroflexota bacterium]